MPRNWLASAVMILCAAGRELLASARSAVAQNEGITARQAFSLLARRSALEGRSILATARDTVADPTGSPVIGVPDQKLGLLDGLRNSRITIFELWLSYFAVGGEARDLELEGLYPSVCCALTRISTT